MKWYTKSKNKLVKILIRGEKHYIADILNIVSGYNRRKRIRETFKLSEGAIVSNKQVIN
jgi:hypothetical protein